jgi:hypothetical protein
MQSEGGVTTCFRDYFPLHVPKRREAKPPSLLSSLNMLSVTAQGPAMIQGLLASFNSRSNPRTLAPRL